MLKQSATNENQSPRPPLMGPGGLPDSERSKQPPLPESPYRPYSEEPALSEPPYKPYGEKPALDEVPYEPYKGI
jgi:hypothetical protein